MFFLVVAQVSSDPNPGCLVIDVWILYLHQINICIIRKPWNKRSWSHIKQPCFLTENVCQVSCVFSGLRGCQQQLVRWQRQLIGRSCYLVASFRAHRPLGFRGLVGWEGLYFTHRRSQCKVCLNGICLEILSSSSTIKAEGMNVLWCIGDIYLVVPWCFL